MRRAFVLLVLILFVVGGCTVFTPTPAPAPTATRVLQVTTTPQPKPTEAGTFQCTPIGGKLEQGSTLYSVEPGSWYVRNQLLLMGSEEDLNRVSDDLKVENRIWTLLGTADFSYLQEFVKSTPEGSPWLSYQRLKARLYDTGVSVDESLAQVTQIISRRGVRVFAEPNRVLDFSTPAQQWSVEGSPFDVPTNLAGTPADAQKLFWNQWAFTGTYGVAPGQKLRPAERTVRATGKGITIAVFDTSPFARPGDPDPQITWVAPQPRLCVSHPMPVPPTADPGRPVPDLRDHGLFVAGLAYGVAPESDIHLIRVLNSAGLGDLFSLVQAGNLFAQQTLSRTHASSLQGVIINLSLGFADPKGNDLSDRTKAAVADLLAKQAPQYKPLSKAGVPAISMETWIAGLHSLGAVVVASAGNDSYDDTDLPEDPQAPALYGSPNVVGVAASNQSGARACYSNRGAIGAPGGDGVKTGTGRCGPESYRCQSAKDPANCGEGLISLVLQRLKPDTGYAFWIGTSFAAPLVSGTIALNMSSPSGMSPEVPLNRLKVIVGTASSDLGLGVINVP